MANTTFNAKIRLRRDTAAAWTQADPVLLNGERILVDTAAGEVRTKTGDGTKTYTQLPFDDEATRSLIDAKGSTTWAGTLLASAWTDGTQTLTVENLSADRNGTLGLAQSATAEQTEAAMGAGLRVTGQSAGSLTVTASLDVPTVDIPVTLILLG